MIALGLAIAFRANVWNIGAEGQFITGAIAATGVVLLAGPGVGRWVVVALLVAGVAGGMVWAAIVAWLRDRFSANEILVSLMLVYVAELLLGYLVYGPWKDPEGFNFPQTVTFADATAIPRLVSGYRANWGSVLALASTAGAWLFLYRTYAGFQLEVGGIAPRAAAYAGFSPRRSLWTALMISGGLAGLAGALEVAGPLGQLTPHLPVGYGFAAIIVAFVGRLHPIGILFSSVLMSMFYIGGELSQSRLGLPKALTGVFQGLLLFALLACDALVEKAEASLMEAFALMLSSSVNAGTVLALAALGLLVNERAGVVNLGAEGMMLTGGLAAYATALHHPSGLAFAAGAGAGAVLAALFGLLVVGPRDQSIRDRPGADVVRLGLHRVRGRRPGRPAASGSAAPADSRRSPTCRSSATCCSAITRWCTSRRRWRRGSAGFCFARGWGWWCAPRASRRRRRTRWGCRCSGCASRRWCSAARCAAWPARTSRSSTRTCGSRG